MQQTFNNFLQKKKWPLVVFWLIVIITQSIILSFFLYFIIRKHDYLQSTTIAFLTIGTIISLIAVFLGMKPMYDISLALSMKKRINSEHMQIVNNSNIMPDILPTVAIVVPIYNDFMPRETKQSFTQTYRGGIKYYILDDSTDENQIRQINDFAKENNAIVLRQTKENRSQYGKGCGLAAAFNYFIHQTKNEWDFMIHLDSGDLLDHDYVEKMIPFFYANKKIGIVGSRYTSYKINSPFQNYASLFENELSLFYVGATQYQNTVMPGAGIVYSKQAIYDIGKWPNFMCEDGAMSFQMMQKGYDVLWTNITHCMQRECLNIISMQKRWERIFFGTHSINKIKIKDANNLFSFSCWIKLVYYLTPLILILSISCGVLFIFITYNEFVLYYKFVLLQILIFIVPFLIPLIIILVNLDYLHVKKNISHILFSFTELVFVGPVILLVLVKTFINLFILRKKEMTFTVTNKRNANINSKFTKNIIISSIVMFTFIVAYILFAYFFQLYFTLLPLTLGLSFFSLSFLVTNIISLFKTKINYDAQKTVTGISIL